MSYYTDQRDEIKAQIEAVGGIGKVYLRNPNPTDLAAFKTAFVSNSKLNSIIVTRVEGSDDPDGELGSIDEANIILHTDKRDFWRLTFYFAFHNETTTPSEDTFQGLVDLIETKFRFLQNLNNKAFFSYPLQRTVCGLFTFFGSYLCHKAEWRLQVVNIDGEGEVIMPPDGLSLSRNVYIALLNQVGTAAPVATEVYNTLGATPVFARTGAGVYTVTTPAKFLIGRTRYFPLDIIETSSAIITHVDENVMRIETFDADGNPADGILNDTLFELYTF